MKNTTAKKRILHVDDELDTLIVVKTILEKEGFEVVSVDQGIKAIEEIKLDNFSLLLLDIMMPDISGWDLFGRISKIRKDYKVIFLSALDLSDKKIKEVIDAGVKDYIKKPFDRDDLVARVKKAINS
ncbi:MAG: response regulator transcription factor [Candidatus Falkowbacteria bacterium]